MSWYTDMFIVERISYGIQKKVNFKWLLFLAISAATTHDISDIFGNGVNIEIYELLVLLFMESFTSVINSSLSMFHVV